MSFLETKYSDSSINDIYLINSDKKREILTCRDIQDQLENICLRRKITGLDLKRLANNVYSKLKSVNTQQEVDEMIVTTSAEMSTENYHYPKIAVCIVVEALHAKTHQDYFKVVTQLYENKNREGLDAPILSAEFVEYVRQHQAEINAVLQYKRDYRFTYFGFRTLEQSYLKKIVNGTIVERPQHMYMRVAIALHYRNRDLPRIIQTYHLLSKGYFTHATPTLFNAGTCCEQYSSCYLMGTRDDMGDLGECWKDAAVISKYASGLGINVSNIRCQGAYINSTQGQANGLRVLMVFNQILRFANQGGKRAGSCAFYLEPWHADIYFFLDLKKNTGAETERARDIFLALMINDIFMQRVSTDSTWSLMCPHSCPNIVGKYGLEFESAYMAYERAGCYIRQVAARDLWFKIMETQIETGVPYIIFKDAVNRKTNHNNLGVINGSNLCAEIVQYSDADEYAICNLASICLPKFVIRDNQGNAEFNYQKLYEIARIITRNLDNSIDVNFYPVDKARISNLRHRPIGVGVQGLADVFAMFRTAFDSDLARDLNRKIFETIYFGCQTESVVLARERGIYPSFYERAGCHASHGRLQPDLWNLPKDKLSGMWDFDALRADIMKYGLRNSLTTTCMPTASTSQINGNNECIEPYTSNIYSRSTLAGVYYVVNRHLMQDLMDLGIWNSEIIDAIKYYQGSIQMIHEIPNDIKAIYRTAWEVPTRSIIEMAADRGPFIDQTQSLNLYHGDPNYLFIRITSALMRAWRLGLKTGVYYTHVKQTEVAAQFGIDIEKIETLSKYEADNHEKHPFYHNNCQIKNLITRNKNTTANTTSSTETEGGAEAKSKVCEWIPRHLRKFDENGACLSCSS